MSDMWEALGAKERVRTATVHRADHFVRADQLKVGDHLSFGPKGIHPINSIMKNPVTGKVTIDNILVVQGDMEFHVIDDPARLAARIAMPNPVDLGIQVGDIFVNSWGYDQTNIDFYEVTGLTGASVRLRPIGKVYTETGFMSGTSVPKPGVYTGPEFIKRIQDVGRPGSSRPVINMDFGVGVLWDGQPERESHYA